MILHIESVKKRILGIVEDSIQGKAGDVLIQSIGNSIVCCFNQIRIRSLC